MCYYFKEKEPWKATGRVLTVEKIMAHNTFENPNVIKPATLSGARVDGDLIGVTIPARSAVALAIRNEKIGP